MKILFQILFIFSLSLTSFVSLGADGHRDIRDLNKLFTDAVKDVRTDTVNDGGTDGENKEDMNIHIKNLFKSIRNLSEQGFCRRIVSPQRYTEINKIITAGVVQGVSYSSRGKIYEKYFDLYRGECLQEIFDARSDLMKKMESLDFDDGTNLDDELAEAEAMSDLASKDTKYGNEKSQFDNLVEVIKILKQCDIKTSKQDLVHSGYFSGPRLGFDSPHSLDLRMSKMATAIQEVQDSCGENIKESLESYNAIKEEIAEQRGKNCQEEHSCSADLIAGLSSGGGEGSFFYKIMTESYFNNSTCCKDPSQQECQNKNLGVDLSGGCEESTVSQLDSLQQSICRTASTQCKTTSEAAMTGFLNEVKMCFLYSSIDFMSGNSDNEIEVQEECQDPLNELFSEYSKMTKNNYGGDDSSLTDTSKATDIISCKKITEDKDVTSQKDTKEMMAKVCTEKEFKNLFSDSEYPGGKPDLQNPYGTNLSSQRLSESGRNLSSSSLSGKRSSNFQFSGGLPNGSSSSRSSDFKPIDFKLGDFGLGRDSKKDGSKGEGGEDDDKDGEASDNGSSSSKVSKGDDASGADASLSGSSKGSSGGKKTVASRMRKVRQKIESFFSGRSRSRGGGSSSSRSSRRSGMRSSYANRGSSKPNRKLSAYKPRDFNLSNKSRIGAPHQNIFDMVKSPFARFCREIAKDVSCFH